MSVPDNARCKDYSGHPIRWPASWLLRADPWPLLLIALILMLGYLWQYRSPTVAMVGLAYYSDFCFGTFLFGLIAAARSIQLRVRNHYEARLSVGSTACRSRRRFWPWLLAIAATTYLMVWTGLPMHICFLLSRPAMNRLADEALADPANAHLLSSRWAGFYKISGVEVIGNTVVLYLGKDEGNYGFARVPGATTDTIFNVPGHEDNAHFYRDFPKQQLAGDPVGERMTGDWFVMYSSYWKLKIGWS